MEVKIDLAKLKELHKHAKGGAQWANTELEMYLRNHCAEIIEALEKLESLYNEVDRLSRESVDCGQYLIRLLKSRYPEIEPLDGLLGICTQIDNGFAVKLHEAEEKLEKHEKLDDPQVKAALREVECGCGDIRIAADMCPHCNRCLLACCQCSEKLEQAEALLRDFANSAHRHHGVVALDKCAFAGCMAVSAYFAKRSK